MYAYINEKVRIFRGWVSTQQRNRSSQQPTPRCTSIREWFYASTESSDSSCPLFREPPFHAIGWIGGVRLAGDSCLRRHHVTKNNPKNSGNLRK